MRKPSRAIQDEQQIRDLLRHAAVGRLATNGCDGYPRIKPLNFVLVDDRIYIHSARRGEKIEDIGRDNRVAFCIDVDLGYSVTRREPCGATFFYRSVLIRGRASFVAGKEERLGALNKLMEKYQPSGGYGDFLPEKLELTEVIRIDIEEITGKQHVKQS